MKETSLQVTPYPTAKIARRVGAVSQSGGSAMTGRSHPTGEPNRWISLRQLSLAVAILAFIAGCSDSPSSTSSSTSTSTSTSTSEASTTTSTAAPTSTTVPPSTTTTTHPAPPNSDVEAAWDVYWAAWAEVRASDPLDPAPLQAVATPDVVEAAVALFERERTGGQGARSTDVVTSATVVDISSAAAAVEDCVLLAPSVTNTTGVWYQADLRLDSGRWIVSDLRIPSGGGCVPTDLAEAAIAGYEAYYDAEQEFWDPADPTHPLIANVLAEPQLSFIVGLLEEHAARGVALRGRPTLHPEVLEVRNLDEVVLLSCSEPHPDYGVYDVSTDERLPDEPPVRPGQRDLQSAVMLFEDGAWKVSDLQGQVDFACEFAPTDRGLPSI